MSDQPMAPRPMTHDEARELVGLYVLGALEPAEEAAVREHLATCGEPHPEFDALGGVVPALWESPDLELVEPPAGLRDRIMAAAAADLAARGAAMAPTGAPAAPTTAPTAPTAFPPADERAARRQRRTSRFDWALRIAAVLAVVAIGAYALNIQSQLDRANRFNDAVAAVVTAAQQPGSTTVVLAQQKDQHGSGIAAVTANGSVVLAMRDLQATSGTQSYTAWVIVGKQAPINVGDFTVDASGTRAFTTHPVPTPAGAIVAVTLEAQAGNPAPLGPIVSAGQVPAQPPAGG